MSPFWASALSGVVRDPSRHHQTHRMCHLNSRKNEPRVKGCVLSQRRSLLRLVDKAIGDVRESKGVVGKEQVSSVENCSHVPRDVESEHDHTDCPHYKVKTGPMVGRAALKHNARPSGHRPRREAPSLRAR